MLSEKLKAQTKLPHQLLEKKLVTILKCIQSKEDYAKLLSCFYRFFGGLEIAINMHINIGLLPDYLQRRKTAALAFDLLQLETKLPAFTEGNDLPDIKNHLQALGALYVIEGSTLGGSVISKMMSRQLNLKNNTGLSFFNGYGDDTQNKWLVFKHSIDQPLTGIEEDTVILCANNTFTRFNHWLERYI